MAERWKLLRQGLSIEPEARVGPQCVQYLGCRHIQEAGNMHDGGLATAMVYDMGDFMQQCVDKPKSLAATVGPAPTLRWVGTHFWLTTLPSHRKVHLRRLGLQESWGTGCFYAQEAEFEVEGYCFFFEVYSGGLGQ